jgi:flagellin-like protein
LRTKRRAGISELVAAVLTIAITIIAGAALFGYVNAEASNSENAIGNANALNVNFLNEHFVIAQIVYDRSSPTSSAASSITIYLYNSGHVVNNFASIEVFNSSAGTTRMNMMYNPPPSSPTDLPLVVDLNQPSCNENTPGDEGPSLGNGPGSFSVSLGSIAAITLKLPLCYTGMFQTGVIYGVKVIGQYGNVVTSYQEM